MDVKTHLKEHKEAYITGGICLGIGVLAGITGAIVKGRYATMQSVVDGPEKVTVRPFSFSFFTKGSGNIVTTIHKEGRGNSGYLTRNLETGQIFATQGDAARAFDLSPANLSSHLNGKFEECGGYHFERLGILS